METLVGGGSVAKLPGNHVAILALECRSINNHVEPPTVCLTVRARSAISSRPLAH